MANVHTVSNQEPAESISSNDLILISQALNSYGTQYKSKKATFRTAAASMEKLFRVDNFKNELSVLDEIFTEYVDGREVEFKYDKDTAKLILNTGSKTHDIDVNDFIASGIIKKVEYKKPYIIITFVLASGKTQEIQVDIGDIQILSAGNGIVIEDREVKIDTDVVATVEYADNISSYADNISSYADNISSYANEITVSSMRMDGSTKILTLSFNGGNSLTANLSSLQSGYNAGNGLSLDVNNTFSIDDSVVATKTWVNEEGFAKANDIHDGVLSIFCGNDLIQTFSANQENGISAKIPKPTSYDEVKRKLDDINYAKTTIRVWED